MELKDRFSRQLVNRLGMPTKHVLVCEDVLIVQANIASHFKDLFSHEGDVEVSYVNGGLAAASIIQNMQIDLIILDHDMPNGSGPELLKWMSSEGYKIPVITFSGVPSNNDHLTFLGAEHKFLKGDVIVGLADKLIKEILKI